MLRKLHQEYGKEGLSILLTIGELIPTSMVKSPHDFTKSWYSFWWIHFILCNQCSRSRPVHCEVEKSKQTKSTTYQSIHFSNWVLVDTWLDRGAIPIFPSKGIQHTIKPLGTMIKWPYFKPILDIMVNKGMIGVLFNLMETMIQKISFTHQKYWALWNLIRVSQQPISLTIWNIHPSDYDPSIGRWN